MSVVSISNAEVQGRIYVANEYPTFARTMSLVGQKLTFSRQITLNVRQNLFFWWKTCKFEGKTYKFLNFSAPYCRESNIQHPTCRVVGIPKYAPDTVHHRLAPLKLSHSDYVMGKNKWNSNIWEGAHLYSHPLPRKKVFLSCHAIRKMRHIWQSELWLQYSATAGILVAVSII